MTSLSPISRFLTRGAELFARAGELTTLGTLDYRDANPAADTPQGSLENPRTPFDAIFDIDRPVAGVSVTNKTALRQMAVWRCVNLIAGAVARAPLNTYRRTPSGKVRATDHYLWPLLRYQANPFMTSYRFKRLMQTWLLLYGNAYAEIEINGRGQVVALWPWRPDRVHLTGWSAEDLAYHYITEEGDQVTLPGPYILHLRGLEMDGIMGLDPISQARQSLGLGAAAEQYGARFFSNNGRPGGFISHPAKLGADAKKNLTEAYESLHRGLRGAHRVAILEEGMKFVDVGIPPENMQFLETRKFQAIDIARLFGVPPHKIAEMDKATFSNIEHQAIEFVTDCLADWCANWEAECSHSLLSQREAADIVIEFNLDALMKGDLASRNRAYATGRQWGWLSVNEIRERENLNSIGPDGDRYMEPLNMQPLGTFPDDDPADESDSDVADPGTGAQPKKKKKPKAIAPAAGEEPANDPQN